MKEPRPRVRVRNPQTDLPSIIVAPGATSAAGAPGGIATAEAPLTTLTQTVLVSGNGGSATPSVRTLAITNSAQLESALRENYTPTSTLASSTTARQTSAATTSSTPNASNSPSLSTLIPAIVAPIVVLLLFAFGLFWWVMRRRANKALAKEPEFVMEKTKNSRKHSRDDSTHSNSSTRKLVPKPSIGAGLNKEPVPAVREISRPSMDVFSDNHEVGNGLGIGVAKSPDHTPAHSRHNSAESQNPSGTPSRAPVAVRNFSRGPARPSTANQEQGMPALQGSRDRSMSNPGARPLLSQGSRPDLHDQQYGRGPTSVMDRPDPRRPPPNVRGPPPPTGQQRGPPRGPQTGPPPHGRNSPVARPGPGQRPVQGAVMSTERSHNEPPRNRPIVPPPAIETQAEQPLNKYSALNPPTPTGAYNGASPISQYSPIIKEHPRIDGALHGDDASPQNTASPSTPQNGSSFTEENMRIARLADSSRLGFYKDHNPKNLANITTSPIDEPIVEPPNPSPRLPPPATRDAPPFNFPPPPPPPEDSSMMPTSNSRRADSFVNDRRSMRSMVSRLSDDEYVDMEVDDAKSDVSSLDEREKWDMEVETRNATGSRAANNSSLGTYGGLGAPGSGLRPPLIQNPGANSAENGSQYSLGRF